MIKDAMAETATRVPPYDGVVVGRVLTRRTRVIPFRLIRVSRALN